MFHSRSSLVVFGAEGCTGSGHRLWRMGGPRRPRWRAWRGEPLGCRPPALAHGRPRQSGAEALGAVRPPALAHARQSEPASGSPFDATD